MQEIKKELPGVTLIMAQSLDAFIAEDRSDPVDWTERADKLFFSDLTREIGLVLMGFNTFEAMGGRALPGRKNIVFTRLRRGLYSDSADLSFTSASPLEVLESHSSYKRAALIGGAGLNGAFAERGLIDDIYLSISPIFLGRGLRLFPLGISLNLDLISSEALGENSLLLHYAVLNS